MTQAASDWLQRGRMARRQPPAFEKLNVAVQRRCIQLQLFGLGINTDYELVERLRLIPGQPMAVAAQVKAGTSYAQPEEIAPTGRRTPAPLRRGGTSELLFVSRDPAGLVRRQPVPRTDFQIGSLHIDLGSRKREAVLDGVRIRWRTDSNRARRRPKDKVGCEYFDAEKVGSQILLRHWRPGDRFQPIGMSNPVKLQDFFTNEKVARARRHELVVAATANGKVFWVEGHRISEQFKLTKTTKRRLQWRWQRL